MVNIVINYDSSKKEYRLFEPTTDTLIVTANLSETFIKLSEFLVQSGLLPAGSDILNTDVVTYHLDSGTLISMVQSNVNLMKRLTQQAPSIFSSSSLKFGSNPSSTLPSQQIAAKKEYSNGKRNDNGNNTMLKSNGTFSKSSFKLTGKKFGSR